jgi:hypothetical protein
MIRVAPPQLTKHRKTRDRKGRKTNLERKVYWIIRTLYNGNERRQYRKGERAG